MINLLQPVPAYCSQCDGFKIALRWASPRDGGTVDLSMNCGHIESVSYKLGESGTEHSITKFDARDLAEMRKRARGAA